MSLIDPQAAHTGARRLNNLAIELQSRGAAEQALDAFRSAMLLLRQAAPPTSSYEFGADAFDEGSSTLIDCMIQSTTSQVDALPAVVKCDLVRLPSSATIPHGQHSCGRTYFELDDDDCDPQLDTAAVLYNYAVAVLDADWLCLDQLWRRLLSSAEWLLSSRISSLTHIQVLQQAPRLYIMGLVIVAAAYAEDPSPQRLGQLQTMAKGLQQAKSQAPLEREPAAAAA